MLNCKSLDFKIDKSSRPQRDFNLRTIFSLNLRGEMKLDFEICVTPFLWMIDYKQFSKMGLALLAFLT